MMPPTMKLPRATKLPNEYTTSPASPVDKMSRVVETVSARRYVVVMSSSVGKTVMLSARGM